MKSVLKKALLSVIIPVILYGCAGAPLPDMIWPEPPDPPRIKYLTAYRSGADFKRQSLASEIILGSEGGFVLKKPMSVHVDADGKIFVTDTAVPDVFIFDPVNKTTTSLSAMGVRGFFKPIGVTTDDSTGRIFVTDSQANKVYAFDKTGKLITEIAPPGEPFKQPSGIAFDPVNKRLFITDTHHHDIKVFDSETYKFVRVIGRRGKDEGEFNFPSHMTVDSKGSLYVTDTQNGRVEIFDRDGKFIRAFGQFGDAPGMFARPKGIAVDSEGHIYVVDAAFNNVQIFNDEGQILLSFSGYGSDRGQLILPAGVGIDKDDYIYVVDSWNRRIQVFEYLGEKYKERTAKKK